MRNSHTALDPCSVPDRVGLTAAQVGRSGPGPHGSRSRKLTPWGPVEGCWRKTAFSGRGSPAPLEAPCSSRVRRAPRRPLRPGPCARWSLRRLLPQAQLIAQSIGQAFSVAYQEFLRANGINPEDLSQKEYSDIINTQEMYNDDLIHFSNSENCKEVSGAGDTPA